MNVIITLAVGALTSIVGYAWGAVNNTEPLPRCCLNCLGEHNHFQTRPPYSACCDHYGLSTLRAENLSLKNEVYRLLRENENLKVRFCDYRNIAPMEKFWFKELGDKERAAAKLREVLKPLEELEKELN